MRSKSIILFFVLFIVAGCIETSEYREIEPADLVSDPLSFEERKICINGMLDSTGVSGIQLGEYQVISEDEKNGTFAKVCGVYRSGQIDVYSVDTILSISTEKDIYRSNETLRVNVFFNSHKKSKGQIQVSGIKNAFGSPLLDEIKEESIRKGANFFTFSFRTPSCEECSALQPGDYYINATVDSGGKTFETYKEITLARSNDSEEHDDVDLKVENLTEPELQDVIPEEVTGDTVTFEYFYDPACQKCSKASPVIDSVAGSYGDRVTFSKHNVLTDRGLELARKYRLPGVPSVVINGDKLISYRDYNGDTSKLEELLREAVDNAFTSTSTGLSGGEKIILSVPSVFVVGFLAGFNPCLLAILAFIASVTLSTTGKRRNVLMIVLMFSLGIFVAYLIVGVGLLRIIEQSVSLQATITNAIILLITLLGIWHVYDAYHLRKNEESSFYTPKAFVRLTESVTKKVSLPAAFFIGALFSLIKAPCVGAVYFVILDMVRSGDASGMMYLASYNLGVVLPVFIIGAGIAFGLDPEKVETFRKERRSAMRLITGVTLIFIAVLMYAGII